VPTILTASELRGGPDPVAENISGNLVENISGPIENFSGSIENSSGSIENIYGSTDHVPLVTEQKMLNRGIISAATGQVGKVEYFYPVNCHENKLLLSSAI
jgi:hypothetical protein